jgi:DNA-binding transcriptional LysR family regulator
MGPSLARITDNSLSRVPRPSPGPAGRRRRGARALPSARHGFEPRVDHLADSLDLVEELVLARLGVGLLPLDRNGRDGLAVVPLRQPAASMRTYVWTRPGRAAWPPLALMLSKLTTGLPAR